MAAKKGAAAAVPVKTVPTSTVPAGTDPLLWKVAAAWADVPVAELLADTATVRSAHYEAALRVDKTFDEWLERHDAEAELRAQEETAAGAPLMAAIQDADAVARVLRLAEDLAALTASARDRGDAVVAARYSNFEKSLLLVAAGLQVKTNDEMGK